MHYHSRQVSAFGDIYAKNILVVGQFHTTVNYNQNFSFIFFLIKFKNVLKYTLSFQINVLYLKLLFYLKLATVKK